MNNMRDFALRVIANNPNVKNNPNAQEMINALKNNDVKRGEEIAQNLCNSYGLTKDEAVKQAKSFFRI